MLLGTPGYFLKVPSSKSLYLVSLNGPLLVSLCPFWAQTFATPRSHPSDLCEKQFTEQSGEMVAIYDYTLTVTGKKTSCQTLKRFKFCIYRRRPNLSLDSDSIQQDRTSSSTSRDKQLCRKSENPKLANIWTINIQLSLSLSLYIVE